MTCYFPQPIYLTPRGWKFSPRRNQVFLDRLPKFVSCGQCLGCRLERSRQWAVRSVHEAQFHDENYFLTLTFDDAHVPKDFSLNTKTIQGFWKRFRKAYPLMRFKYYCAGEYGDNFLRPHYHASTFGMSLPDLRPSFKSSTGYQMYTSKRVQDAWSLDGIPFGNVYIAPLTFETAAYTARYICKKILGKGAAEHYAKLGVMPEKAWMSKGLGRDWHDAYKHETYRDNYISVRGVPSVPPRTYNRWLKKFDPEIYSEYEASTSMLYVDQVQRIQDIVDGKGDVSLAIKEAQLSRGKLDISR